MDLNTRAWTWLSGSLGSKVANFGTPNIPAASNQPGGRMSHAMAMDTRTDILYLFGGSGLTASKAGYLNDLWQWDPATGFWTFIGGGTLPEQPGVYGQKLIASSLNEPGARGIHKVVLDSDGGALYLFGGTARDGAGTYVGGLFSEFIRAHFPTLLGNLGHTNDLWSWSIQTRRWTWINGSNLISDTGAYGQLGVASPANSPPCRDRHSMTFNPTNGMIYMFGGYSLTASKSSLGSCLS